MKISTKPSNAQKKPEKTKATV